ncbi:MAG: aspartyl/asparaginyl beta-hydroxylase domain-containing protein [Alphaproteobacteria bacterium]|nr:aspartyl/asparaginyl beta-hydroxylase domain-containing protein [Alphaproteobacteria bacterium]
MAVAKACHQQGNQAAEEEAIMQRLNEERGDLLAISAMAELKRTQGDQRAASSFYRLGLGTIAQMKSPHQSLLTWAQRAQAYLDEGADAYVAHMSDHLSSAGIEISQASAQVKEAFDLLTGKTELYLQQPNMFFYPGLPHRAWFEREEFEWVEEVEGYTDAIIGELKAVVEEAATFEPYVQAQPGRPNPNNPLLNDPNWGAGYLLKNGERQDALADRVPSAMKALEAPPLPTIPDRAPMALFSRLKPGTHIKPHHGMLNTRLICHLPLIVPEGCGIRVGATSRVWEPGKLLIFDDSMEHEAWNRGASDRTVMIFEIWRPEISFEDREVLSVLFGAINQFGEGA